MYIYHCISRVSLLTSGQKVLRFLINKIRAIGKLNDVSHNSSWFLTNDPFFSVVYDQYFPECHVIITTHLNKSVVLVWLL